MCSPAVSRSTRRSGSERRSPSPCRFRRSGLSIRSRRASGRSPVGRSSVVAAVAAWAALSAHPAPAAAQDLVVDTTGAAALVDQALSHSAVMQNLQYLTDVIGPRLTGSRPHEVTAASWAWAPGTGGATVTGPVVRIDASTPDSLAAHRRWVKGAWVMTRVPSLVWNNDGPPMTGADSARQREFIRTVFTPFRDADSATRARLQQFANDVPYLLHRAGALGIVVDAGKEHALLNMSGSPNRILPLPQVVVAHEDFALFDRLFAV